MRFYFLNLIHRMIPQKTNIFNSKIWFRELFIRIHSLFSQSITNLPFKIHSVHLQLYLEVHSIASSCPNSSDFLLNYQFSHRYFRLSKPICFRLLCDIKTISIPLPLTRVIFRYLGSGDCAIFHDIVYRFYLVGEWLCRSINGDRSTIQAE